MNNFDIKAKKIERAFVKKLKEGYAFQTGTGIVNQIDGITKDAIFIKPKRSKKPQRISREKFREAIAYLLYRKTATRKEMEPKTDFTSSILGLLRLAVYHIARFQKTVSGLLRLTITGVRFFFSGMDRPSDNDMKLMTQNEVTFFLNNYYHLRERSDLEEWMAYLDRLGIKLLIDTGGLTVYNKQEKGEPIKPVLVSEIADFINRFESQIYGYFTLDVIGDPLASKRNYNALKSLTNLAPIPIWHCNTDNWKDSDFEELERLVNEDHSIIGIGATKILGQKAGVRYQELVKKQLFEVIFSRFPEQNFHCLGLSSNLLLDFPFFSADSTGWLQGRSSKQVYTFTEKTTTVIKRWNNQMCLDFNVKMLKSLEGPLL